MTARLDISHREDKKGLDLQVSQLTDAAGVSVLMSDITGGNVASGTFAGAVSVGTTLAVTGVATFTAAPVFTAMPVYPVATLAAAGSTVTDAAQLVAGFTWVTAANATKGVKLPATPAAGTVCIVKNDDTANAVLKVWPDAAATINAIGSNADIAMPAKTAAIFIAYSSTQWFTIPLLPS
jgi:hypothetical protein